MCSAATHKSRILCVQSFDSIDDVVCLVLSTSRDLCLL